MEHFDTPYQSVIYKTRYSRWIEQESRREEWPETVQRYVDYMFDHVDEQHGFKDDELKQELYNGIYNLDVLPSMRALRTAGPALERSDIAAYNCAYLAVDEPIAFDEALFILMNGTGVGFSVEKHYVDKLPQVPNNMATTDHKFVVPDSKEGWARALRHVVLSLYSGVIPDWDLSEVRPEGARLKTFGGFASGPEPLNDLLNFVVETFVNAVGRKLSTLECHEIMCMVGDIVVVGGVRRAALISLSNLDDDNMRDAKSGNWWEDKGHLRLANNSAVYEEKPSRDLFDKEWDSLIASKSGERGIFNREGAAKKAAKMGRDLSYDLGTNPCGEILLRNKQFCNLSTVMVKPDDTPGTMKQKIRLATIIGTLQSTLTDFPYLSDKWKENCEEERLLGVSIGGIFNNPMTYERGKGLEELLRNLRELSVAVNMQYAHKLGINRSKSITTNKPDGNSSQLVGVPSGMHPWHADYYVRNIQGTKHDPVSEFLKWYGVENDTYMADESGRTDVFSFPIKVPEVAKTRDEVTAIEHLEVWKTYSEHWTHHNPSVTISVKDHEWGAVGDWVYENFDYIVGVSFLPYSDHVYKQAPYEDTDERGYKELLDKNPDSLPWENLSLFEEYDTSNAGQQYSCMAGGCTVDAL